MTRVYMVELIGDDYVVTKGVYSTWERAVERANEVENSIFIDEETVTITSLFLDQAVNSN